MRVINKIINIRHLQYLVGLSLISSFSSKTGKIRNNRLFLIIGRKSLICNRYSNNCNRSFLNNLQVGVNNRVRITRFNFSRKLGLPRAEFNQAWSILLISFLAGLLFVNSCLFNFAYSFFFVGSILISISALISLQMGSFISRIVVMSNNKFSQFSSSSFSSFSSNFIFCKIIGSRIGCYNFLGTYFISSLILFNSSFIPFISFIWSFLPIGWVVILWMRVR